MVYILTSNIISYSPTRIDKSNGFIDLLKKHFVQNGKGLFICSKPDGYDKTDIYANELKETFIENGLEVASMSVLDNRTKENAIELINNSDFIVLAGGHVPTQNRFFNAINLRGLLKEYKGLVLGISAGSMNAADVVYCLPELPGEAEDKEFMRFMPGLGITNVNIIPHYQAIKEDIIDGKRVILDLACIDSQNKEFYCLTDGAYLYGYENKEEIHGETYRIKNGKIQKIVGNNDFYTL